jgi:ubiquinone biosynthesis protein Coq4
MQKPLATSSEFPVSPWEMIKAMSLRQKLRMAKSIWSFLRYPERTDDLWTVSQLFLEAHTKGENALRAFVVKKLAEPTVATLFGGGYLPKPADLQTLARLPQGSLGKIYADHMHANGFAVVFYPELPVVDEVTWFEMRMRQTHDIWHVLTGFSTSVADELGLQAFTAAQLNSPMNSSIIGGGLMHAAFFEPAIMAPCLDAVHRGYEMGKNAKQLMGYPLEMTSAPSSGSSRKGAASRLL